MRQRRADSRACVSGDLALDFGDVRLTTYAWLESFGGYLRTRRFNTLVRTAFADVAGCKLRPVRPTDAAALIRLIDTAHADINRRVAVPSRAISRPF